MSEEIRIPASWRDRVMSAEQAATLISRVTRWR